ncbi:MAG: hypothetical protein QY326_08935 [Bdellovibrionota bacterium]|nr:MAG: hypothetical protein QY326_08935 [Bdellovibrionota bacterium]
MNNVTERFNALGIEPVIAARMRLKQATIEIPEFAEVDLQGDFGNALQQLNKGKRTDVIFISPSLPEPDIASFIQNAKKTPGGQDAAYILVMRNEDREGGEIAKRMLIGADGFLFEPFSVDALKEITHLATKVKKDRADEREKMAINVLVGDICRQLDEVAYIKACQFDVGTSLRKLREKCSAFNNFTEQTLNMYFNAAIDVFEKSIPRAKTNKSYGGVSNRVRDRMAKKIMREADKNKA